MSKPECQAARGRKGNARPQRLEELAVLGRARTETLELVLVGVLVLVRVLLVRPRVGLAADDAVHEELDKSVERAVRLPREPERE